MPAPLRRLYRRQKLDVKGNMQQEAGDNLPNEVLLALLLILSCAGRQAKRASLRSDLKISAI
jgi:hypothetical protein